MTDTLYKINSQDGVLTSMDTEKLLFNDSIEDIVGNAYILRVNHNKPKAITGNQALGQGTKNQQPQGLLGEFYTINATGDGTQINSTIERLKEWADGLDTIPSAVIHGIFGFEFNTVSSYKVTPISSGNTQIGLMWGGLEWKFNLILNIAEFTIKLKVDRGNDS
jgi:hypothetical protein